MADHELARANSPSLLSQMLRYFEEHTYSHPLVTADDFAVATSRLAREDELKAAMHVKQQALTQEVEQAIGNSPLVEHIRDRLGRRGDGGDPLRPCFRGIRPTATMVIELAAKQFFLLGYENPGQLDAYEQPLVEHFGSPHRVYFDDAHQARNSMRVFWAMGEELRGQQSLSRPEAYDE